MMHGTQCVFHFTHGTAYHSQAEKWSFQSCKIDNLYIIDLMDMMSSFTDKSIFPLEPE